MRVTWQVVSVVVLLGVSYILWLVHAIKRGRLSWTEIGRWETAGTSSDPLTTSPYFSPRNLFIIRLIIVLWLTAVYIETKFANIHNEWGIPSEAFYTVWTWISLWCYFVFSCILTLNHCFRSKGVEQSNEARTESADGRHPPLRALRVMTCIIFESCCSMVLLVDIAVWCLWFPFVLRWYSTTYNRTVDIEESLRFEHFVFHTTNFMVLYLELLINNISLRNLNHIVFCSILLWIYCLFEWALYSCCSVHWAYPFVDPSDPENALSYVIVFGINVVCWLVAYTFKGVVVEKLIRRKQSKANQTSDDKLPSDTSDDIEKQTSDDTAVSNEGTAGNAKTTTYLNEQISV